MIICCHQAVKLERGEPSESSHSHHSHSHSQIPPPQAGTDSEVEVSMMVSALTQVAGLPPLPMFSSSRSSSSLSYGHPMVSYDPSIYSHARSSQLFSDSDSFTHTSRLPIPTTPMVGQKRPRDEIKEEPAVEEHQLQHQQFSYGGGGGGGAGVGSIWPPSSSQENLFVDVATGMSADCSWAPVMGSVKREQSSVGYYSSSSSPSYTNPECIPDSGHLSDITRAPHFSPPQDIFQGVQIFLFSPLVTSVVVSSGASTQFSVCTSKEC